MFFGRPSGKVHIVLPTEEGNNKTDHAESPDSEQFEDRESHTALSLHSSSQYQHDKYCSVRRPY